MKNINLKSLKKAILYSQVCISMACTQMQKNDMKGGNEEKKKTNNQYTYEIITKTDGLVRLKNFLAKNNVDYEIINFQFILPPKYQHYIFKFKSWNHGDVIKHLVENNNEELYFMHGEEKKRILTIRIPKYLKLLELTDELRNNIDNIINDISERIHTQIKRVDHKNDIYIEVQDPLDLIRVKLLLSWFKKLESRFSPLTT